jgi:hypothetical protein
LTKFVEKTKLEKDFCFELLSNLFGPNPNTRLTTRKNVDLEKALAQKLSAHYIS